MSDSKRLEIKKLLTEIIENTPGHNLKGKVWRGRNRPGAESGSPFVLMFELPPEDLQSRTSRDVARNQWSIGLRGYIRPDEDHLTDPADNFMADVLNHLSCITENGGGGQTPDEYMLGRRITDFVVEPGIVFPGDETTNLCNFAVKIEVQLVEKIGEL